MRFPFLCRALLVLSSFILISACAKKSDSSRSNEIDTLHVFFENNTIYSIKLNPNDEDVPAEKIARFSFDEGDNQYLKLNTDDDKQGFEYALFVNTVSSVPTLSLFDYVTGNKKDIATFEANSHVCGIFSDKAASKDSIVDQTNEFRDVFIDNASVFVEISPTATGCDNNDTNTVQISFELDESSSFVFTPASPARTNGINLIDFRAGDDFDLRFEEQPERQGTAVYVGINTETQEIEAYTNDGIFIQTTTSSNGDLLQVEKVTDNRLFVQADHDIYIIDLDKFIEFAPTSGDTPPVIPNQSPSDLFNTPEGIVNNLNIALKTGPNSFILEDGNELKFLKEAETSPFEMEVFYTKDLNLVDLDYFMPEANIPVLHKTYGDRQVLSKVNTGSDSMDETTLAQAQEFQVFVIGNFIYVNALNEFDLETTSTTIGWKAMLFEATPSSQFNLIASFDQSSFIEIEDYRSSLRSAMLISSRNEESMTEDIVEAELSFFDTAQANNDNRKVLGKFANPISRVLEGKVINDIYGYLLIENSDSVQERYYFDPTATDEMSLHLIANPSL